MARYTYENERFDDPPGKLAVPGYDTIEVSDDGTFEVPDDADDDVHERIREQGHEPLPETTDDADGEEDPDPLDGVTEDHIVEMDYREMQGLASDLGGVKGNAPEGELEEALILAVREGE